MARIQLLLDGVEQIADIAADDHGRFCFSLDQGSYLIASGQFVIVSYDGDGSHAAARNVVGLIFTCTPSPFSQLVQVVLPRQAAEVLCCIGLVVATSVGFGSMYLTLRTKRATSSIVSH